MMGIAFLSLGLVSTVIGVFLLLYPRKLQASALTENSPAKQEIKIMEPKPVEFAKENILQKQSQNRAELVSPLTGNKKEIAALNGSKAEAEQKGVEFEKYVVKKFNKNYFSLTEWTSDKFIDGVYAENTLGPDLVFQFSLRNISEEIAVECKWRKKLNTKYEIVSAQQIKNYRKFEQKRNIPVYLILGVGGEPSSPENLYILPLDKIQSTDLNEGFLIDYKQDINTNIFYDYKVKSLTANQVVRTKEQF